MASSYLFADPPLRPHLSPEQLAWCAEGLKAFKSLLQSPSSISAEYDRLRGMRSIRDDFLRKCREACELINSNKNRYMDVLPYDETRVKLKSDRDCKSSGRRYINASFIKTTSNGNVSEFIATQGPLPQTIKDLWDMVIQYHCPTIVMLTVVDYPKVPHLPRSNWVPLSSQKYVSSGATAGEKPTTEKPATAGEKSTTEKPATVGEKFTTEKPAEASHKNSGSGGSEETGPAGKPIRGGPVSWLSLVLLMLTGGGLLVYYDKEKKKHLEELKTASTTPRQGPSVGTPAIGGPFKLVNHDGKSVTEQDFLGKWTILYFGFTHCPDICPDELQKLCAAIDKIKEKVNLEIVPVFISVDPERDTVEQVSEYVKEFHPNLIGLTGTPDEVKKSARAYRVYYMKTEEEGSDYLVDHSIVMYLMSPEMQFVKFFGKNYDVDSLTEGIIKELKQHGK